MAEPENVKIFTGSFEPGIFESPDELIANLRADPNTAPNVYFECEDRTAESQTAYLKRVGLTVLTAIRIADNKPLPILSYGFTRDTPYAQAMNNIYAGMQHGQIPTEIAAVAFADLIAGNFDKNWSGFKPRQQS